MDLLQFQHHFTFYYCQLSFIFAVMTPKYKRILLKLSGEALMGEQNFGIDPLRLQQYAADIKEVSDAGVQVAMGMLATVINGMALQSALENVGLYTRLLSAIKMEQICEPYIRRRAIRHLEKGRVVIFGAGTGNPYFTTDTAASLRAIETEADVILKGTRVDGVYTADPEKDPAATKYENITFKEVIAQNLNVMDMTAFTLCAENNLPIIIFDMNKKGNLLNLLAGENVGTLVSNK